MGKIAFVFPGQGAQVPGMGLSAFENSAAAKAIFEKADAIRPGTSAQCFEGSVDELKITKNTQSCLYVTELALAAVLTEQGFKADMCAGFSLGELSALCYAGAIDFETGLKLVMRRGELMQQDAEKADTFMAAVIRLPEEKLMEIIAGFDNVYAVNFNGAGQITVAGAAEHQEAFSEEVKEAGGRAMPLKVSGAFHSPYMNDAAKAFEDVIAEQSFKTPEITVYSDTTGKPYEGDVADTLKKQIINPVHWETIVKDMIANGVDTFIEVGPGKTLTGLIKRMDETVKPYRMSEYGDIEEIKQGVLSC
ncbi:MAG: ACP S-malonyltransferase [Lachnospiraceae bacterium]|nr:ACP S-malonyltransferase [Lachnospiraceae bacterium]